MSFDFARIKLIASREWSQKIRQRSFLISTIVLVVGVLALVLAPVVLSAAFGNDEGSGAEAVLVDNRTDLSTVVEDLNGFAERAGLENDVRFRASDGEVDASSVVVDGDADGVLAVERAQDGTLAFTYTNVDGSVDQTAVIAQSAAGEVSLRDQLQRLGVDPEAANQVQALPQLRIEAAADVNAASEDTEQGFRYAVAYASALVMYMVVLIYGMWVAQGVVEEKSSRIMEIMINAASPTDLMYGKILGIGLAGLTQLLPLLAVAGIGLYSQQRLADAFDVTGYEIAGIDFGQLSVQLVGYFLVYFVLGFIFYSALYAGVGSLVSRQEDLQAVMAPMTFAIVIGFFGAIFTLSAPDSTVAKVVSIVPLTSPMAMMPRIMLGHPSAGEIAISIGLLAASGALAVWLAARIYRMGVLMYGQKPSLKVIFRRDMTQAAR